MSIKGIETPEYQVNVLQENLINKFAVQGEENSRVLTLHLVETMQTVTALGKTVIRQKPLDLAGCTVRLYVKKPDGNATFTDGTIVATGADANILSLFLMVNLLTNDQFMELTGMLKPKATTTA